MITLINDHADQWGTPRRWGAELWSWARMSGLLSLQTTNVWASYSHRVSSQWGLSDRALSQNISLWYTNVFSSVGELIGGGVTCPALIYQAGCHLFTYRSLLVKQNISYPGRSWAPKLYLTPIQNGSFIQNGFSFGSFLHKTLLTYCQSGVCPHRFQGGGYLLGNN